MKTFETPVIDIITFTAEQIMVSGVQTPVDNTDIENATPWG